MRLHLYIAALALLLGGCAQKITKEPKTLENLSHFAVQTLPLAPKEASRAYNRFLSKRYMPWQIDKINASMEEIRWGERFILKNKIFSFNRKPLKRGELNRVIVNSNYGSINILRKRAITIYPSNLRLFPSSKPLFLDPSMPGEGYPFDYNQNSAIKAMTPLFVSHLSLDGGWAFVQTPFALGWLPIRDIAYLDKSETLKIMGLENVVIVSDNTPIYDAKQNFLFYAKIGSIFPAVGEQKGFYEILIPKKAEDRALFQKSLIPASKAKRMPLDMSKENIFAVAEELLGEPYGWGGVAGGRDCSAMTRDFFAPFGIWLPRNSAKQAKEGEVVELSGLSDKEKERAIIEKGVPFRTLIHLKGHIMLYVGAFKNEPYVLHNIWGIKTKENGRYIIGRAVITSLNLGKNLPEVDQKAILIRRIDSMNTLP